MGLFTSSVSSKNQVSKPQEISPVKKAASPKGISSSSSSISSSKKDSTGIFTSLKSSIKNVFLAFFKGLKYIFYRIFPFGSPTYAAEAKYRDFKSRLNRVDSIGKELALKEADENPYVYTMLGRRVYRSSWNVPWRISTWIPKIGKKTYKEIGQAEAEVKYKKLAQQLKIYYTDEMANLKVKIDNNLST